MAGEQFRGWLCGERWKNEKMGCGLGNWAGGQGPGRAHQWPSSGRHFSGFGHFFWYYTVLLARARGLGACRKTASHEIPATRLPVQCHGLHFLQTQPMRNRLHVRLNSGCSRAVSSLRLVKTAPMAATYKVKPITFGPAVQLPHTCEVNSGGLQGCRVNVAVLTKLEQRA